MAKLTNLKKVISLANESWVEAEKRKITSINAKSIGINQYQNQYGIEFTHLCTTSYLGLEYNQKIINGAIHGIGLAKILRIPNSRNSCIFTSAVFFPVVPQGLAAIRVTLRADISSDSIKRFCSLVKHKLQEYSLIT
jgi:7-keto-8-aminopelargonate synthetase-like enzyme